MVTMDDDGIPSIVPGDPFAHHAEALTDLATEPCRGGDVAARQLCEVLRASVKYARALLAVQHGTSSEALAAAVVLAEQRITNIIGSISSGGVRERMSSSVM
jgi:hypothetical protein